MKTFELQLAVFFKSRFNDTARESLYQTIWKTYQKPLLYFIQSMVKQDAEDVFQDVMIKVYKNLHQYNPLYAFGPWIYAIARNQCLNHLKKKRMRTTSVDTISWRLTDGHTPETNMLEKESADALRSAMQSLSRDHQQIAFLKYFEQFTCRQIGTIMNIPSGTVKSRLYAIRIQLKKGAAMKKITPKRQWWLAGLLSYLLPGLGQFYNGRLTRGLLLHFLYSTYGGLVFTILFHFLNYPLSKTRILFLGVMAGISLMIHFIIIIEAIRDARKLGPVMDHSAYQHWYIYMLILVVSLTVEYTLSQAVRQNIAKPYRIPAVSMEPTLKAGDYLISNQLYFNTRNPGRGDVVIHQFPPNPRQTYVKRIIGLPNDTLAIVNKQVLINGRFLDEPYVQFGDSLSLPAEQSQRDNLEPFVIPDNEYFVMGDNRDNSNDSRFWGTVARHQIHGKPAFVYWSWNNQLHWIQRLFSIRLKRIGKLLES